MPYADNTVGYQRRDTSLDAAVKVRPWSLRGQVLECFKTFDHLSTEDICEILGRDYRSVQPRVSELARDGKIIDSGVRTDGLFKRPIIVWRLPNANDNLS